jgi:hypothetical protein
MSLIKQSLPEFDQIPGFSFGFGIGGIFGILCSAPLTGVFSVIGFAIGTALIHWVALFLGGKANFDRIAYALGAIYAPITIISAFLVPFYAIRFAAFCILPLLLAVGIYALYLQIAAVKAVHGFGWLEASIAVFLPVILIVFLCAFTVIGLMRAIGPSLNNILQQIQPSL